MNPAVVLRDMRQDEYEAYSAEHVRLYAADLAQTVSFEDATARARAEHEQLLPDGIATRFHRLLVAEDSGQNVVGHVWLGLRAPRTTRTDMAWLFDIRVETAHRGRGYGAAILAAAEALARDAGARRLGLNVFGGNDVARRLYDRSGYKVTTLQMAKPLT